MVLSLIGLGPVVSFKVSFNDGPACSFMMADSRGLVIISSDYFRLHQVM
jgi:hypothetical protein